MKIYKKLLIIVGLLSIYSCQKELSITEFSDDFSNYKPELRIEALILPTENTAIVRVDKSVLITDISLYDCIDNDFSTNGEITLDSCIAVNGFWHGTVNSMLGHCGDWNPLIHDVGIDGEIGDPADDDGDCDSCSATNTQCQENCRDEDSIGENNGVPDCNEPNVDNYNELLPNIHEDECIISMTKINDDLSEDICEFIFDSSAGEFFDTRYNGSQGGELVDDFYTVTYGAYVPDGNCSATMWVNEDGSSDTESEYSFNADCSAVGFGTITSKKPITVSDPVVFVDIILNSSFENPESQTDVSEYLESLGIGDCIDYDCLTNNLKEEYKLLLNNNFVYFPRYSQYASILWATISPNVYFQATEYMYDSTLVDSIYFHGHPSIGTNMLNIINDVCLMGESIFADFYDGYGNGEWDDNSQSTNSKYSEIFADKNGNGRYDQAEPFDDEDGNNQFDEGESFQDVGSDGVSDLLEDGCGYSLPEFIRSFYNFKEIINELEIDYDNWESKLVILDSLTLLNNEQELIDENENFIICGGNSIEDPNNDNWNDCGSDNNCSFIDNDGTQGNNIWEIGEGNENNSRFDDAEFFIDRGDNIGDIDTYYYEISTFSESYKNYYFYPQLLPNDPERSNLRDENMNPVMGAFGSITTNKINFKIIDCLEFLLDEESCANEEKTHGVCEWYPNVVIDDYTGPACLPINWDF